MGRRARTKGPRETCNACMGTPFADERSGCVAKRFSARGGLQVQRRSYVASSTLFPTASSNRLASHGEPQGGVMLPLPARTSGLSTIDQARDDANPLPPPALQRYPAVSMADAVS